MSRVFTLWGVTEREKFREQRLAFPQSLQAHLKREMRAMRCAQQLPGPEDLDDFVPPVYEAWERAVPGTVLRVLYSPFQDSRIIKFWAIRR